VDRLVNNQLLEDVRIITVQKLVNLCKSSKLEPLLSIFLQINLGVKFDEPMFCTKKLPCTVRGHCCR